MSKQYDDEMKGIMFEKERPTDNHPLFKGHIQISGVRYWISGWPKQTSNGPAISLSIQEAKPAADAMPKKQQANAAQQEPAFFDDDIPF